MATGGGARIGDPERQKVIELLRHHTGQGRLTLDEFTERAGEVFAAMTRDDLAQVIADLPDGVRPETAPPETNLTLGPTTPSEPSGRRTDSTGSTDTTRRWPTAQHRRRFVGILGKSSARGTWRAPRRITAFAYWGSVHIDLRSALIESPEVDIRAWSIMGGVRVTVPEGIPVDLSGCIVMGGSHNRVLARAPLPDAPLVRVRARGLWGSVLIRNPRKRRRHPNALGHAFPLGHHGKHTEVHEAVGAALDTARQAVDRALTTGSVADWIPGLARSDTDRQSERVGRVPTRDGSTASDGSDHTRPDPEPKQARASAARLDRDRPVTPGDPSTNGARIPHGTLTILVSDIAGSTQLAERLGDQVWLDVLQTHNVIVREHVAAHGGTEVKAQGDGFLVVFASARSAVLAAIAIQRAMRDYGRDHAEAAVELRLGLHTGEVIVTDDDVFGQNVAVASRIADAAEPGEIVVSGLTRDLTASASDLGFDDGTDVTLKGVSQRWRVHRVHWT